jgi:hypothetical protein
MSNFKTRLLIKIKNDGVSGLLKSIILRLTVYVFYPVLPANAYLTILMYIWLGYKPNIKHPRTFNEKTAHRKIYAQHPLSIIVADKWRVRDYVSQKGLSSILNEVYWYGNDPEKIPFKTLPEKYVIKANHGSGWNIVVTDSSKIDRTEILNQCHYWLKQKYGKIHKGYELFYDDIEPVITIEKYLEDDSGSLRDYKLFCFQGLPEYIQVSFDRYTNHTRTYFDKKWEVIDLVLGDPRGPSISKPRLLNEMIEISKILSSDFDFIRVDLYEINGKSIVFGELTLTHAGGFERFYPGKWDYHFGELWK